MHPVGGATAKLHTQNRTFRKFATHAPTGGGSSGVSFRPNFVQPLNFSLLFLSLPYPFYPPSLPISPSSLPFLLEGSRYVEREMVLFLNTYSPLLSPSLSSLRRAEVPWPWFYPLMHIWHSRNLDSQNLDRQNMDIENLECLSKCLQATKFRKRFGALIHMTECSCAPSRWRYGEAAYSESHISQVRNSCTL